MSTDPILCLQCGESRDAIRASQSSGSPLYCGAVDYFGECEWEADLHRFRDWSDRELIEGWRVLPEHVDLYRRIMSAYEIDEAHRAPFDTTNETGEDR